MNSACLCLSRLSLARSAAAAAAVPTFILLSAVLTAAETTPSPPVLAEDVVQLDPLVVQATRDGDYFATEASAATKSLPPLLETPRRSPSSPASSWTTSAP
jgi:hypothetical protein